MQLIWEVTDKYIYINMDTFGCQYKSRFLSVNIEKDCLKWYLKFPHYTK